MIKIVSNCCYLGISLLASSFIVMPSFITGQTAIAQQAENVALTEARSKVSRIDWEISQAESSMRRLSPPIRTQSKGVTTYDQDEQRQFEMNRDRINQRIENLKQDRTTWELQVNQILLMETMLKRTNNP
jgi:hypothetical protein